MALPPKCVNRHGRQGSGGTFSSCEQDIEFALGWVRRYLVRELDQLIGHARHCGDHRDDVGTFALRFDETTRHVTDSLRCSDGSATVFLNNQAHVRDKLDAPKRNSKPQRFRLGIERVKRRFC